MLLYDKFKIVEINIRSDISFNLLHFTKGGDEEAAFKNLLKIIADRKIEARTTSDKVGDVVCLTETPFACIQENNGFKSCSGFSFTSCFGILFTKSYLYQDYGARPVLYMESDFIASLDTNLKWRAQIFQPKFIPFYLDKNQRDYHWQREWRTNRDINLDNEHYHIIIPSDKWLDRLQTELEKIGKTIYDNCIKEKKLDYDEYCEECSDCNDPEDFLKQNIICITGDC